MYRRIAILAVVASALLLIGLPAGQALAAGDDDIPGIPIGAGTISGMLDETTDPRDVYCIQLFEGEAVHFHLATAASGWLDYAAADLIPPGVTSVSAVFSTLVDFRTDDNPDADYTPAKDGVYYLDIGCSGNGVSYTLTITGSAEKPPNPAYLRLRTSATKVSKGHSVTLSAKLVDWSSVLVPGYTVKLYRSYNGHSWTTVKSLSSTTGNYSTRARITRKTWYKMGFGGDATWSSCSSRAVTIALR